MASVERERDSKGRYVADGGGDDAGSAGMPEPLTPLQLRRQELEAKVADDARTAKGEAVAVERAHCYA